MLAPIRHYICLALFSLLTASANAQVPSPPPGDQVPPQPRPVAFVRGFRGVLVAGLNACQIDGDKLSGYNKPGFVGGFAAIFDLTPTISLGPEFLYSGKGARTSQDQLTAGFPYLNQRIHYFDFPILLHFKAARGFTISVGPSFNALISAKYESGNAEGDNTANWSKLDIGLTAGLEYAFLDQVSVTARFYYSALPANVNGTDGIPLGTLATYAVGSRNNVISFQLRYYLIGGARRD